MSEPSYKKLRSGKKIKTGERLDENEIKSSSDQTGLRRSIRNRGIN